MLKKQFLLIITARWVFIHLLSLLCGVTCFRHVCPKDSWICPYLMHFLFPFNDPLMSAQLLCLPAFVYCLPDVFCVLRQIFAAMASGLHLSVFLCLAGGLWTHVNVSSLHNFLLDIGVASPMHYLNRRPIRALWLHDSNLMSSRALIEHHFQVWVELTAACVFFLFTGSIRLVIPVIVKSESRAQLELCDCRLQVFKNDTSLVGLSQSLQPTYLSVLVQHAKTQLGPDSDSSMCNNMWMVKPTG